MPLGGHHSRDNRANVPFNENKRGKDYLS